MRKTNKGFTLVELLVVMAIISILAAIAVPNVAKYLKKSRAVKAIAEIENVETAMTKLLSDAGRSSLNDLINLAVVETEVGDTRDNWTADMFEDAVDIYTDITYVLLREGRGALNDPLNFNNASGNLLNEEVVRNLGTTYMTTLGFDPWGNLYRVFPGPWSTSSFGPIPFRVYLPSVAGGPTLPGQDASAELGDAYTIYGTISGEAAAIDLFDPDTGEDMDRIGIPADDRTDIFIWSYGENGINGQAYYLEVDTYTDNDPTNYVVEQAPELRGGGDDINNWDTNQTFMRFYN